MELSQNFEAKSTTEVEHSALNFDRLNSLSTGGKDASFAQAEERLAQIKALPELTLAMANTNDGGAEKNKLVAESGSTVYAGKNTEVIARAGSKVYAERGAVVHADKGAEVFARNGSNIFANDGTSVNGSGEQTIHQDKGATITVPYQSKVSAYKDAVIQTTYGEVYAYDGSTVYAYCERNNGIPYYPPTIHAKGKCTIFAVPGATVDAEPGSTPILKGWAQPNIAGW